VPHAKVPAGRTIGRRVPKATHDEATTTSTRVGGWVAECHAILPRMHPRGGSPGAAWRHGASRFVRVVDEAMESTTGMGTES